MRLIALIFLMAAALQTQAQQFNFRNWSLEQGLPQSQVNAILQDHSGYLWVATLGGLSRFNGNSFLTYTKRDGMSSNSIRCLFEDSGRNIWIGTTDAGLMRLTGKSFELFNEEAGLPPGGVYSITEDDKGVIWAATDSGVYFLSGTQFERLTAIPSIRFNAVLSARSNELWLGSATNGLYNISPQGIAHYTHQNSALPHNTVNVLSQSPTGTIWVGTAQGVAVFNQQALKAFPLPKGISNQDITGFTTDTYGHQWISLRDRGVVKYDGDTLQHLNRYSGLRTDRVNALITDQEGNIWFGTSGYGLMQYRNPWFVHYFDMGHVKEPIISALAQDTRGRVWLGTDDGYAAYMEDGLLNWLKTDIWPVGTTLYSMWIQSKNDVWVCTSQGVYRLGPTGIKHFGTNSGLPSQQVYQAMPDRAGNLLLATAAGLALLSPATGKVSALHKPQLTGSVYTIHRDARNQVWLGAEKGIFRLVRHTVTAVPQFNDTGFREVHAIAEDKQGHLYFGGFNYGILAMHQSWASPKLFTSRNGLPNEGIKSLYVDRSNHLWVGTSHGVLKLGLTGLTEGGKLDIRTYANQDGFRGLEVSNRGITQTPDGTIWFATSKGLTMYLPKMDRQNKVFPNVMLTNVMLFLKPTDWASLGYRTDSATGIPLNLRLPYNQNHITLDFHGISLTAPDRVRYRYRLKGHDDHWSAVTDQSFATYASLDPGTYTFQLLASNSDGFWTPNPMTYTFVIVPPVWRREWFIVLLVLIAAGATISVVRLRERSLLKLNTMLEQKVRHRTQLLEAKNREKEILLKEIHHRVKNNLQIIMSMLNLQARHVNDTKALEVMQSIRGRVRSMSILHERLYQHEDLASIDLNDYFQGICDGLYATFGISPDQVAIRLRVPNIKVEADTALSLGLIVNELVSNSFKYAFPNQEGSITITLEQHIGQRYRLEVQDNGVGLPPDFSERRKKSFGLQLVSSLAKKLHGEVQFQNNNGTNSILYFVLTS